VRDLLAKALELAAAPADAARLAGEIEEALWRHFDGNDKEEVPPPFLCISTHLCHFSTFYNHCHPTEWLISKSWAPGVRFGAARCGRVWLPWGGHRVPTAALSRLANKAPLANKARVSARAARADRGRCARRAVHRQGEVSQVQPAGSSPPICTTIQCCPVMGVGSTPSVPVLGVQGSTPSVPVCLSLHPSTSQRASCGQRKRPVLLCVAFPVPVAVRCL